jgi:DNA-binding IclR family transcriptional regulator
LFDELKIPVMLATPVGNEVLALTSIPDRSGRTGGMKTGQRRPLLPFATLFYVAWSSEADIEKWIARAGVQDKTQIEEWRQTIALIRKRGYQLTLLAPENTATLSEMVNQMAMGRYENQSMGLVTSSGQRLTQPENIQSDERYDVAMIAAPIFADNESAPLGLSLGGFTERLTGAEIEQLAEHLMRTCLRIMRDHRAN